MDNKILLLGFLGIFFGLIFLVGLMAILSYNNIQNLNLEADNSWGKVQTVYQERFDLIPRIVQSVNAQTSAEKEIIKQISDARARYISGSTPDERASASSDLDRTVRSAFPIVLAENYPNLQFALAFRDFRTVYEGQENRIRVERNRYNDAITEYNKAIKTFPGALFAGMMGFKERKLFEATTDAQNAPEIKFN